MAKYSSFRENYLRCSVPQGAEMATVLGIPESNIERVVGLLEGSVSVSIHRNLAMEYRRIFSMTVRRFHEAVESRRNGLIYGVCDHTRSLFELMLQAFFLIRSTSPAKIALDAYNFSMMSWYLKRNELLESGDLENTNQGKWQLTKEKVEGIFSQYGKRRPKFYLDLTVRSVARDSGLERHHRVFYSMLSSPTHNEPSTSDDRELLEDQKLVLFVVPKNAEPREFDAFLNFANQMFLVTSVATLLSLLQPNREKCMELIEDMKAGLDKSFWAHELSTIVEIAKHRFE
jgi:hypothetical protein